MEFEAIISDIRIRNCAVVLALAAAEREPRSVLRYEEGASIASGQPPAQGGANSTDIMM